jgi:uncharacterized protein (TIGR03437 family)
MKFAGAGIAVLFALGTASGQVSATVDIDTSVTIPVNPNFSGFNTRDDSPVEYWDYRFNTMALALNAAWLRFPGGTNSDVFNWQSGQAVTSWVAQFANTNQGPGLVNNEEIIAGKGGARFIDAANRANFLGAGLIVCVNGFTDTPASAGAFAAWAKANGIPVAVWELSNEPYLFPTFFATGAAYIAQMKPYRDAIKAADPSAVVSIFFADPSHSTIAKPSAWDTSVVSATDRWWGAVTYHQYPAESTGGIDQWMADENTVLVNQTNLNVTGYLASLNPPGTKYEVSEFEPSSNSSPSMTDGTVYGGVYCAEYILRMSTEPSVLFVGANQIDNDSGIERANDDATQVANAGKAGTPFDTLSLDFGFYYDAQALALGIVNGVVNHAVKSNQTTVTGGATVAATGSGQIPALYALAYTNAVGGVSVVITNKSATTHQVTIRMNGSAVAGPLPLQFVTGAEPGTNNSPTDPDAIVTQAAVSGNPITVGPYSVVRADLASPPIVSVVSSANPRSTALASSQRATTVATGLAIKELAPPERPLPSPLDGATIVVTDSAGKSQTAVIQYPTHSLRLAPCFQYPNATDFLLPAGLAPGAATLKVMRGGTTVLTGSFNVQSVSPGLYSANCNGAGVAAAVAERKGPTGTVLLPVFACQDRVAESCLSTPIDLGASSGPMTLSLFGTGIRGASSVQAFVAGQSVPVLAFGAEGEYEGLDQVSVSLPLSLAGSGEASVYLVADGEVSNMVTVNIQ